MKRRIIIIAMTGASGAAFGEAALRILQDMADVETHLVMSDAARRTIAHELEVEPADLETLADVVHDVRDIGAAPASGSFPAAGMLVAPCSIRTLSAIAWCNADNLITRCADVMLKERRPLVLMVRESPLHLGHLRAMTAATEAGAVIAPPVPAFYARPADLAEVIGQTVRRSLALLGVDTGDAHVWNGSEDLENS